MGVGLGSMRWGPCRMVEMGFCGWAVSYYYYYTQASRPMGQFGTWAAEVHKGRRGNEFQLLTLSCCARNLYALP